MTKAAGFTLVELLVALVAGSFLIVSLSWTLATLSRQLSMSEEAAAEEKFSDAAAVLAPMLERIQPPADGDALAAETSSLDVLVPPPAAAGDIGLVRLQLEVRQTGNGEGLFARLAPLADDSDLPSAARREVAMLDGYRRITFDYVSAPLADPPRKLPALIVIETVNADGEIQRIAAAPKIDSDGSCRFDPISMSCRY